MKNYNIEPLDILSLEEKVLQGAVIRRRKDPAIRPLKLQIKIEKSFWSNSSDNCSTDSILFFVFKS